MDATASKLLLAGLLAIAAAALPASAVAKAPGHNGRIVFEQAGGPIYTVNPDGTDLRQIAEGPHEGPHWSSDGRRIAMHDVAADGRDTTALVDPDGSGLATQPIPDPLLGHVCLAWAPDDRRLACEGWYDPIVGSPAGLFTIHARDWGGLARVTTNPHGGPDIPGDYSPDGTRIAFIREDPAREATALFVVGARGGEVRQIGPWQPGHNDPSWSPDGRWILRDDAQGSLWVVRPDGTGRHRIHLRMPGFAFQPGWSPDGRRIVFSLTTEDGRVGIYTARARGSEVRPVAISTTGFLTSADWGPAPRRPKTGSTR